ncbi:MAG: hypothetical protein ACP5VN_01320 [Acidobacteriota bacterium]
MKGKILLAAAMALGIAATASDGTVNDWTGRTGLRTHARLQTGQGETVTVTRLDRSKAKSETRNVVHRHTVLLLEGPSWGRWIFEASAQVSLDARQVSQRYILQRPGGEEALSIQYLTNEGDGRGEYRIAFSGQNRTVREGSLAPSDAGGPSPMLAELPSEAQKAVLLLCRLGQDFADWGPDERFLQFFFGTASPPAVSNISVESLPVDCTFDASFGFPCGPDEEPRVQGKVLVKPLE